MILWESYWQWSRLRPRDWEYCSWATCSRIRSEYYCTEQTRIQSPQTLAPNSNPKLVENSGTCPRREALRQAPPSPWVRGIVRRAHAARLRAIPRQFAEPSYRVAKNRGKVTHA